MASFPWPDIGPAKPAHCSSRSLLPIGSFAILAAARPGDRLSLVALWNPAPTGIRELRLAILAWCDLPRVGSAPASLSRPWPDYGPETIPRQGTWSSRSHHPELAAKTALPLPELARLAIRMAQGSKAWPEASAPQRLKPAKRITEQHNIVATTSLTSVNLELNLLPSRFPRPDYVVPLPGFTPLPGGAGGGPLLPGPRQILLPGELPLGPTPE